MAPLAFWEYLRDATADESTLHSENALDSFLDPFIPFGQNKIHNPLVPAS